jgi:hypothetical protein
LALPLLVCQNGGISKSPNSLVQTQTTLLLPSIPRWSVLAYLIASSVIFFWCIGGLVLALFVQTPPTSSFDTVDFAARIIANHSDESLIHPLLTVANGRDAAIREALEDKVLFVRDVAAQEINGTEPGEGPYIGKIGFTMNSGEGHNLIRRGLYA